jgi:hypothetical protein
MKKMKLFKRGRHPQGTPAVETTPTTEPKTDYASLFIKRRELKTRQCVYISYDVHAVIAKLVGSLASTGNDLTIGGYIDTVLAEHLQRYKGDINEFYRRREGDLL